MHYYLVATTVIAQRDQSSFTYQSESSLPIGTIVQVSVGKKTSIGVVQKKVAKPSFETKAIDQVIEQAPLPSGLLDLHAWLSTYYATHPATVLQTILPSGLQKKRRISKKIRSYPKRNRTNIVLNNEQLSAIDTVLSMDPGTALLEGVTGSGKTQVYIELAKKMREMDKSSIILVPEIVLTAQLIAEFSHHFTDIVVTHSTMTEAERHHAWLQCLNADSPLIVIGPRSAIFSPLKNIGLIVIDECHEPSFKQEHAPRYSALRAASMLARFNSAKVVLGSATPTIADRYLAEKNKRPIIRLRNSARLETKPASISLVDMTNRRLFRKHRFLSDKLLSHIESSLDSNMQSLLFHNRRGSAPTTLCTSCGWIARCPRCDLPLTLHSDSYQLRCHVCNYTTTPPTTCPECGNSSIEHKGLGTKIIESELQKQFPEANIARFDGDNDRHETAEKLYEKMYSGDIDIIVGTQVVAKGLDLPNLRTVGVIQADSGLAMPDFHASERVFQLVSQVCGRVGRNKYASDIVVQTYRPKDECIAYAINGDYEGFFEHTIPDRKSGYFPPFSYLLKVTCSYKTEVGAINAVKKLALTIKDNAAADVRVFGPAPAFHERIGGSYRWRLVLKSATRQHLLDLLPLVPPSKWQVELDPSNLL